MAYTLGLDLGPTSIGWALIDAEETEDVGRLVAAGVRVFPEGVKREREKEESKNQERRLARSMRRLHDRRGRRKVRLRKSLQEAGMLPTEEKEIDRLLALSPYQLRRKGLDEELTLHELGRALVHLNQRRGFKGNRKENDKEEGPVKEGISKLRTLLEETGARTLGEYFAVNEHREKVRGNYLDRRMVLDEFNLLWDKQSEFHPVLRDAALRQKIQHAIFFQRPLKSMKDKIGICTLEPEHRRAPKGSWYAHRIRILQEANDLRIVDIEGNERSLVKDPPTDERQKFLHTLSTKKEWKVEKIKEFFGLNDGDSLNIERSQRTKIAGNSVEYGLRKLFGKSEFDSARDRFISIYEKALELEQDDFEAEAPSKHGLTEEQVSRIFKIIASQPKGYAAYSIEAMKNLIPHLEKGMEMHEAKVEAGYFEKVEDQSLDSLPLPDEIVPNLTNPIVKKALYEVRRVVNAVVREYGKPAKIRVELAREAKAGAREREEMLQRNRERERERENIEIILREGGVSHPSGTDVLKYRLWEECNKICPYTGKAISFQQLFGPTPEFEIEHVLPYSRSLDNSQANKTLCHIDENRAKGNRTPWEFYGSNPEKWDEFLVRIRQIKNPRKRRKLQQKEIKLDECIDRQMNDTRYISKQVRLYLRTLGVGVDITRGDITATLRHHWGLNSILNPDGDVKNRDDHRHHAVDAIVTALTTPKHLHNLSNRHRHREGVREFPPPWDGFRDEVQAVIADIVVSHRVTRKISGALHEETSYGKVADKPDTYVYRKPLEVLTAAMVDKIVDPTIRELVRERMEAHDNKAAHAFKDKPLFLPNKNGEPVPIKRVRIYKAASTMIPARNSLGEEYRFMDPGSNHHASFFEVERDGRKDVVAFVTSTFQAAAIAMENGRRRKGGLPDRSIIRRTDPDFPDAKFLFSLSKNEMVALETRERGREICRVQTISFSQIGQRRSYDIRFRLHTASTIEDPESLRRIRSLNPENLRIIKITVDPLGRVHEAND